MAPEFSIVIPAYNQAEFIGETLESVFRQTCQDFEIIVVNDASPDNTAEVVAQFTDPRLHSIVHPNNKGLPATRNTGMRAASGKYIALLDADDLFHPQKLELHSNFLNQHPEIGVTYNARFNLNYSDTTIRDLSRPPLTVDLEDILRGYPFAPSDMVIRKSVVDTVGYFDDYYRNGGEDMEYPAMLALAGVQFASVDRALNFRRFHSRRYRKNLDPRLKDVQDALAKVYADPRCPAEVRGLGESPLSEHTIVLVYHAFMQNRTEDGHRFMKYLLQIKPGALDGTPCEVVEYFAKNSSADEKEDHETILRSLFTQLPALPVNIDHQLEWAIHQGYLIKAVRAALWDREADSKAYFQKAFELGATFTDQYLQEVVQNLVDFEYEMGTDVFKKVMNRLLPEIHRLCPEDRYHAFVGEFYARRAFQNYHQHNYRDVPGDVLNAVRNEPRFLKNRGMLSILTRSIIKKTEK